MKHPQRYLRLLLVAQTIPSSPQPFPGQKEVDGQGNSRQDTAVSIFLRKAYELRRHVLTRGNATVNIKKNFCAGWKGLCN